MRRFQEIFPRRQCASGRVAMPGLNYPAHGFHGNLRGRQSRRNRVGALSRNAGIAVMVEQRGAGSMAAIWAGLLGRQGGASHRSSCRAALCAEHAIAPLGQVRLGPPECDAYSRRPPPST